jgi:hypothetical protein
MFFLFYRLFSNLFGEIQHRQIQADRERDARVTTWRPGTHAEAEEAEEDQDSLDEAEDYEKARQWKKALAIYRELAKCSPVPKIVVKAKMGIKRVKRAQGV